MPTTQKNTTTTKPKTNPAAAMPSKSSTLKKYLATLALSALFLTKKVIQRLTVEVTEPDWYQAYQCVKIDAFFLIKRYDLFYRGEWKKGVPYGFGEVVTRDGEYFKGFFQEGVARGPKCIFMQSSETYYIGSVERNQRHGRGRFIDRGY